MRRAGSLGTRRGVRWIAGAELNRESLRPDRPREVIQHRPAAQQGGRGGARRDLPRLVLDGVVIDADAGKVIGERPGRRAVDESEQRDEERLPRRAALGSRKHEATRWAYSRRPLR